MNSASGVGGNKDWGLEKAYLHSTRQNLWNKVQEQFNKFVTV